MSKYRGHEIRTITQPGGATTFDVYDPDGVVVEQSVASFDEAKLVVDTSVRSLLGFTAQEEASALAAAEFVHNATCSTKHDFKACINGRALASMSMVHALRHLAESPRDAAGARKIFHDAACVSGCGPESDHAKRTQSDTVAALRKWIAGNPSGGRARSLGTS